MEVNIDDYWQLHDEQDGRCAICGSIETSENRFGLKTLAVDHDHVTGKVRGLLCSDCNLGLGKFHDDISRMEKAIEYLKREPQAQVELLPLVGRGKLRDPSKPIVRKAYITIPQVKILRERVQISIPRLASICDVSYRMIYRAEEGKQVSRKLIQKVLDTLNSMQGTSYTFDDLINGSIPTIFDLTSS
jgi:hypothetical protein